MRACLNKCNYVLIYIFHIVQTTGLMISMIAVNYGLTYLTYLGIGLNFIASLINIFEQTNNAVSKKLLKDIQLIKINEYTDEGNIIDAEPYNLKKQQHDTNKLTDKDDQTEMINLNMDDSKV